MADVVSLRKGADIVSDGRAALLEAVAQSFDEYVKDIGEEPSSIAYVLGTMGKGRRTGWLLRGSDETFGSTFLVIAGVQLQAEGTTGGNP